MQFDSFLWASDGSLFHNKKFGYQFNYPSNWEIVTDEATENACRETPPAEATEISISYNRSICVKKGNCYLQLTGYGDGTQLKYSESLKIVNEIKEPNRTPKPVSLFSELPSSDKKMEIVIRESTKTGYNLYSLVYCEKAKKIFMFYADKEFDKNINRIEQLSKPFTFENMYTSEQIEIISSFKCPTKNAKKMSK